MATLGIIGLILGTAASAWGARLTTETVQYTGNPRIRLGSAMSFLGGVFLSIGGTTLVLSF